MDNLVAAPYMTQFRCLGGDCEDTCCAGWDIPISPEDHQRLTLAIGPAADEMTKRVPDGRGGSLLVIAKRKSDGKCPQLAPEGLCSLHARLGERVLPDICSGYPRFINRLADSYELTGRLSCPEVVRLCLLGDASEVVVPSTPEPFGRIDIRFEVTPDDEVPYLTPFVHVRNALIAICRDTTVPIASRLYAIAALGERIGPFYHRDARTHEPERLVHELVASRRPEMMTELHDQLQASPIDGAALTSVMGMIQSRLTAAPAFARVVGTITRHLGEAAGVPDPGDPWKQLMAMGPQRIWDGHIERRKAMSPLQIERLEQYLERYAANYWLQDWYPLSPTLLEHAMKLFLRVALLRYLLLAHPGFTPTADVAQLDRTAVELFYATTRVYDHSESVREALSNTLTKRKLLNLSHAAALLRL